MKDEVLSKGSEVSYERHGLMMDQHTRTSWVISKTSYSQGFLRAHHPSVTIWWSSSQKHTPWQVNSNMSLCTAMWGSLHGVPDACDVEEAAHFFEPQFPHQEDGLTAIPLSPRCTKLRQDNTNRCEWNPYWQYRLHPPMPQRASAVVLSSSQRPLEEKQTPDFEKWPHPFDPTVTS